MSRLLLCTTTSQEGNGLSAGSELETPVEDRPLPRVPRADSCCEIAPGAGPNEEPPIIGIHPNAWVVKHSATDTPRDETPTDVRQKRTVLLNKLDVEPSVDRLRSPALCIKEAPDERRGH